MQGLQGFCRAEIQGLLSVFVEGAGGMMEENEGG